ncbi:M50 family metallopeptidase [Paenalkalicoccus suaedae]|uniref:M50 family metallopeptidase n=1 Tax=Paenalkalicoccus suaedae TaxID=2592382 RepID=A0A859FFF0_9BACI|nr:M50 family metallopeptidase [Paenalkalicoccus suaedae]QKS71837.1 M50 family metallopeptidase [Paenalkalicoccus suaedae]
MIKEAIFLVVTVCIHELGHAITASLFGWKITKISLMPFGGEMVVDSMESKPLKEEIFVIVAGPLQHAWMIPLIIGSHHLGFISSTDYTLLLFYQISILLFNLFPILPLDGGRLLYCLLQSLLSIYHAQSFMLVFSCFFLGALTLITITMFTFQLNFILMLIFLWIHVILLIKQAPYYLIRVWLTRSERSPAKKKVKRVPPSISIQTGLRMIKRPVTTVFTAGGYEVNEKEICKRYFAEHHQNSVFGHVGSRDRRIK